jgi:hypothetical protein
MDAPAREWLDPPANLAARAIVSYLPHSDMLLEVHDEAGRVLHRGVLYRLYCARPAVP